MSGGAPDEFGLIAELFAPLAAGFPGALGLTDDAAFIAAEPGFDTVATMDSMVAGVHFLADDPPDLVARKLIRVNLSDLAAKGAEPRLLMLSAAFPRGVTQDWLRTFGAGLAEDVRAFGVHLIGGDTVSTPGPLTLTLTALGGRAGRGIRRSGAQGRRYRLGIGQHRRRRPGAEGHSSPVAGTVRCPPRVSHRALPPAAAPGGPRASAGGIGPWRHGRLGRPGSGPGAPVPGFRIGGQDRSGASAAIAGRRGRLGPGPVPACLGAGGGR
ncbi:Thiamine monophosphate kinase [Paramagnetospirillum magneticum AMB-1]|uniref:Thiamine monophosphate kinase n=1 Tax=Paramagnetospirillum magneticum (strain ATCC 700264 / AMB-1) TaxID=342108 RepID=Q2W4S4_PARM1|nr:Thiamine monophosphate kinase [Paramagnetospirillum magneticum AMB-1]